MKIIKYFAKSQEKISARGLNPQDVEQTCLHPEQTLLGRKGRIIVQRRFLNSGNNKEYLLRVIFEETVEEIRVVTAYRTSKIKKYWREER